MQLESLTLGGYKSFGCAEPSDSGDGRRVRFSDVTVLLGANGAGKSNVVSFFRLLASVVDGGLQEHIQRAGTADALLHYGAQHTPEMSAWLAFGDAESVDAYSLSLSAAAPDTLAFSNETVTYLRRGEAAAGEPSSRRVTKRLGAGHRESLLQDGADSGEPLCGEILDLLRGCGPYHFHDTSDTAKIRRSGYIEDAGRLRSDAGNLAAFLLALCDTQREYYNRIVQTIRQVCPQFADFDLAPSERNPDYVRLNWREKHHLECLMGPHQLSDGTLRFMALATLFLQPPERAPAVVVLDEPELGLHPTGLAALAGLIKGSAPRTQTILATESVTLVNHFDLSQVRPMAHYRGESRFLSLDPGDFADWLADYATGELWEKDVLGGGPRYE